MESLGAHKVETTIGEGENASASPHKTNALLGLANASTFLEAPKVLNIVKTGFRFTYKVESGLRTQHFYVSGSKNIIKHMDTKGTLLDEIATESKNIPRCFTVNKKGHLLYSDSVDRSINLVSDKEVKCLTKLGRWKPQTVCSTFTDELLVGLKAEDDEEAKVVRYALSDITQEIKCDDEGQPLYRDPHYIDENKNLDIVVSDLDAKAVTVVDKSGHFRFRYQGIPSDKLSEGFGPRGVTTDSLCNILVADFDSNLIHVIDQDGQFLRFIENCGLHLPLDLSVNSSNILFVVEYYSNKVKEVQYLK